MSSYSLVQMVILCPAAIAAAAFDWRSRRIPNVLVVAIAVAGLVAVALTLGSSRLPLAIGTGVAAGAACTPLYVLRGLGAGDVKLIAATSVWWSLTQLLVALTAIALCGALLAIGYLLISRDTSHVPYGMAIAASTVGTVFLA
jgi:Flp pilus assembly protein protease CpaA